MSRNKETVIQLLDDLFAVITPKFGAYSPIANTMFQQIKMAANGMSDADADEIMRRIVKTLNDRAKRGK